MCVNWIIKNMNYKLIHTVYKCSYLKIELHGAYKKLVTLIMDYLYFLGEV